jgi:hypothetical protein
MSFYAYIHCKPDGTPFYVGKGTIDRIKLRKRKHNKWHQNIVGKYGADNILVGSLECSSEEISFDLERGLIKRLKIMGVELVNQTDGGDGRSGSVVTEEVKNRISQKLKGSKNFLGQKHSPEARAKISKSLLGNKRGCGKIFSEEHREKLKIAGTGRAFSDETKAKIAAKLTGNKNCLGKKWATDGVRNKRVNAGEDAPLGWRFGKVLRSVP